MLRSTLIAGAILLAQSGLNSAQADIILEVSDDGTDLTLQWTGTMNVGKTGEALGKGNNSDHVSSNSNSIESLGSSNFIGTSLGTRSSNDPWIFTFRSNRPSNGSGTSFGFSGSVLFWDGSFGATPGVIAPDRAWTLNGLTVADAFGTNLDSGPVLLWTNDITSDTISVGLASSAAVPEPSSFALLGLGGIGVLVLRRRKSRADAQARVK